MESMQIIDMARAMSEFKILKRTEQRMAEAVKYRKVWTKTNSRIPPPTTQSMSGVSSGRSPNQNCELSGPKFETLINDDESGNTIGNLDSQSPATTRLVMITTQTASE